MSRPQWLPAALALAGLISFAGISLAGCVTTPAGTGAGSSGGSGATNAANHEQALTFAQCMRDNGIGAFPDPNASGAFTIDDIANGSSLDTHSAAWTTALGACKDLEPAGFTGGTRSPAQQAAALTFAQCIRDHGVKDFPDPTIDDPLIDTNTIPSAATTGGMSILNAAMRACRAMAAAAGVSGP